MRFCSKPFEQVIIGSDGGVRLCCFIPRYVGNIFQIDIEKVWVSRAAREIRASILDRSFKYCSKSNCDSAAGASICAQKMCIPRVILLQLKHIQFNHDSTCNLYCVSCRENLQRTPKARIKKIIDIQATLLEKSIMKHIESFTIAGAGEPFASRIYLDLMKRINRKDFPNLKLNISTNGLLLTPMVWKKLKNIHYAVNSLEISIDGATKKTYEKVRRGGDFKELKKNLEYLSMLRKENKIPWLSFKFVVSSENFHEMIEFVKFGRKYNCDDVYFQLVLKFKGLSDGNYRKLAVHHKSHPRHKEFIEVVNNPIFNEEIVITGNLDAFRVNRPSTSLTDNPRPKNLII